MRSFCRRFAVSAFGVSDMAFWTLLHEGLGQAVFGLGLTFAVKL